MRFINCLVKVKHIKIDLILIIWRDYDFSNNSSTINTILVDNTYKRRVIVHTHTGVIIKIQKFLLLADTNWFGLTYVPVVYYDPVNLKVDKI